LHSILEGEDLDLARVQSDWGELPANVVVVVLVVVQSHRDMFVAVVVEVVLDWGCIVVVADGGIYWDIARSMIQIHYQKISSLCLSVNKISSRHISYRILP
jgi:hypothetical protein